MKKFWSSIEESMLYHALTPDYVGEVASIILSKMMATGNEITMISGPLIVGGLGSVRANIEMLFVGTQIAEKNGRLVFDRLPFEKKLVRIVPGFSTDPYIRRKIIEQLFARILASSSISEILFLPSWTECEVCSWERSHARKQQIITRDFPADWILSLEKAKVRIRR